MLNNTVEGSCKGFADNGILKGGAFFTPLMSINVREIQLEQTVEAAKQRNKQGKARGRYLYTHRTSEESETKHGSGGIEERNNGSIPGVGVFQQS